MFHQADPVWAHDRAGHDQARQPAVTAEYGAGLSPEGDEVGEPVAGGRGVLVLLGRRVGHQVEQILAGLDVAVERGRAGAELGSYPPHGDRFQSVGVGDSQRDLGDPGPAPLRGAADGGPPRAHPDAPCRPVRRHSSPPFAIAVPNLVGFILRTLYAKQPARGSQAMAQDVKEELPAGRAAKLPRHVRFLTRRSRKGLPAPACRVTLERGIRIPMPDGTHQLADRYIPQAGGPRPRSCSAPRTGAASPMTSCTGVCSLSRATTSCCRAPGEPAGRAVPASRSLMKRPTPTRRWPGCAGSPGSTVRSPRSARVISASPSGHWPVTRRRSSRR